jgi:flagellar basal-body rod modification protein FlgD
MQLLGLSAVTHKAQALAIAQAANAAGTAGTNGTTGTKGTSGSGSSSSSSASSLSSLTNEQTFLQLLIAQIQNQDPLNPTDSIQFVSQLVQYSELGQLVGINQGVQTLAGSNTSTTPASGTASNPTNKSS